MRGRVDRRPDAVFNAIAHRTTGNCRKPIERII
jgi:hypothetical protein